MVLAGRAEGERAGEVSEGRAARRREGYAAVEAAYEGGVGLETLKLMVDTIMEIEAMFEELQEENERRQKVIEVLKARIAAYKYEEEV